MSFLPTTEEELARDRVFAAVVEAVVAARQIPVSTSPESPYVATAGGFTYAFEGEEDLLHLEVRRLDGGAIRLEDARKVASFALPDVPVGLVWVKPAEHSVHFYLGHDVLVKDRGQ
ncbi:MAG: hypothetical protein KIT11_00570 [Fimbriimonadaceae bacterium]|nr:hypothetical protein [Fimbriimonadaceae bacterium]QYK55133.1 MAG: hypothetical protein KF733_08965 [Fimbriimonadaceae bacterium]